MHIQIVNINGLQYTKNLIDCLLKQTVKCKIRLVDQSSSEEWTDEYLSSLSNIPNIEVIRNTYNVPLNWVWNHFYKTTNSKYLCFLNNDVVVPSNFVEDTINIFEKEKNVGCVVHATNHPDHCRVTDLDYVMTTRVVQGWDFTFRREVYKEIPRKLLVFGGDDFLFNEMYRAGWHIAIALSSPIIHFNGISRQYCSSSIRKMDNDNVKEMGYARMSYRSPYTIWKPSFNTIIERGQT